MVNEKSNVLMNKQPFKRFMIKQHDHNIAMQAGAKRQIGLASKLSGRAMMLRTIPKLNPEKPIIGSEMKRFLFTTVILTTSLFVAALAIEPHFKTGNPF